MAAGDGGEQLLLDFIGELYDAAADPLQWSGLAPRLARLFGADSAALFTADPGSKAMVLGVTENVDGRFQRDYARFYYKLDEWLSGVMQRPGEVLREREVAPDGWHRKSEFFGELRERAGIHEVVGSAFLLGGRRFGVVGVHRARSAPDFGDSDIRCLKLLVPHLARAMQLALRFSGVRVDHQAALDGLERTGTAIIAVDQGGMILFANSLGEMLLRHGGGLRSAGGRLAATDRNVDRRLAHLIDGTAQITADHARGRCGGVAIERDHGRLPITILVTPFRPALPCGIDAPTPTALVLVRDPETPTMAKDILVDLFGFTPAQAAVAARLAAGEDLEHIAATMHISLYTVRDHLKVIFAKTGVTRQSQLVALLAPTVAMLGGMDARADAGAELKRARS